jgi:hypothetical protein
MYHETNPESLGYPWDFAMKWGCEITLKVEMLAEITLETVSDSGLMDTLAESMEEFNLPPLPKQRSRSSQCLVWM